MMAGMYGYTTYEEYLNSRKTPATYAPPKPASVPKPAAPKVNSPAKTTYSAPVAPKATYSAPAPTVPAAPSESKYLWQQDAGTGLYQNLNLGTGQREGATYDKPFGNVVQPIDPYAEMANRIAALEGMLNTRPAYDIDAARGRIQDWGSELKASMIAKIEAARKGGLGQYANAGTLATQQTKSALDQNAVDKARAIEQILQASEAAGQGRGGMNVSGQIAANTMAQQNANLARTNLSNNLAAIEQAKADVNTQADQAKIGAEADVQARVLQAIMEAEQFGANMDLQGRGLDLQNKQFNFSSGLQTKQFDADQAWRQWQKDFEIENQAWQRSADNPALQAQVLANKSAILNNQLAELELQNYPEEQKLRMQQLRKEIAQIGKAPAMSQYEKDMQNIKLDQARIELENTKNGQKTDYTPFIKQLYLSTDPLTGQTTFDADGARGYIINLNLPDAETDAYLLKYGLPTN